MTSHSSFSVQQGSVSIEFRPESFRYASHEPREARNLRMQLEIPGSRHRRGIVRRSWMCRAPATTRMDGGAHPCTARCRTLSPSPCKATLFLFLFQPIRPVLQRSSRRSNGFPPRFRTRSVTEFVGNRVEKASFLVFARREKRSCVVSFVMDELTIFRKKVTVYIVTVKMYT